MPGTHAIFASVNRLFFAQAEIFLRSIRKNYPKHPEIHFFHADLGEAELKRLSKFPRTRAVRVDFDECELGPPMASHHGRFADPRLSYLRFLIWTDRFDDYDTVVHLDLDILVFGPLDGLFSTEDFLIYPETYQGADALFYDADDPALVKLLREDGIKPGAVANAGVFTAPKRYRTRKNYERLIALMNRYRPYIKWSDQSVLNLWLAEQGIHASADTRYNFQHRLVERGQYEGLSVASIFHFNGVDLALRVPMMRAAWALHRLPGGWRLYRLVHGIAMSFLRLWRKRQRIGV